MIEPGQVLKTVEELREANTLLKQKKIMIEFRPVGRDHWQVEESHDLEGINLCDYDYRRAPEPHTVPLGPEDVPPGSVIKTVREHQKLVDGKYMNMDGSNWSGWSSILSCSKSGLLTSGRVVRGNTAHPANSLMVLFFTWEELRDYCHIKRPGEDWQPCYKIAVE